MSNAFDKASLVMLPHAYEDGKLYSLKPTDRSGDFTFSRGTGTATRVGEDGYIKKEIVNLLEQSNSFDTTWNLFNGTLTSGQSGYDGTNDAWLLDATTQLLNVQQNISVSGVQTFSIYAKAGTEGGVFIRLTGGGDPRCFFNLNDGVVGTASGSPIDTSIEFVGNDWYRCSISLNETISRVSVYLANDSNGFPSSGSIYIQDAQINQGLVAQEYLETTTAPVYGGLTDNMPRLDYTDATCPSLLLEPSRTNLVGYSEYRGGGTNASVVNNSTLSPEGVSNGCLFIENTALNSHGVQFSNMIPTNANAVGYTISVFAKAKEREHIQLSFYADSVSHNSSFFDILNGTTDGDPNTHKIEDYGNGWYRCSYTQSVLQSTGSYNLVRFLMSNGSSGYYTGDNTSGLYMWGLQVEAGSYPTSYIPTYGSSQTRAADSGVASNVASLIGQTEGTIFIDGASDYDDISNPMLHIDYSFNDRIQINLRNDFISVSFHNTLGSFFFVNTPPRGDRFKFAVSYQSGNTKFYLNGSLIDTKTQSILFGNPLSNVKLNDGISANKSQSELNEVLLFQTALSDDECIALTTL